MEGKLLYASCISFALGILARSLFFVNTFFVGFLALLSGVFFAYGALLKFRNSQFFKTILVCSFLLAWCVLGIVRVHIFDMDRGDSILNSLVVDQVTVLGIVSDEPDERENNTRLTVDFETATFDTKVYRVKSKGIVTVDLYPQFSYGDKIKITGKLQKPQNFTPSNSSGQENDLGREFNYVEFLAKDGIYYQMFRPKIELIKSGEGNLIKEKIFAFKNAFLEKIKNAIPEPEASLSGGLLLGTKQSLGKETLDDFRTVGLIHIVVLSGYNITIVAESLMRFFSYFLRRRLASSLGILSIILFAVMTGAGATVVRASIMASLVLVARLTGRNFDALRALFMAGFVMLLHNPKILLFDPSFQLSFMATLGLISLSPIISKYIHFLPEKFGFKELTASTISTQIFVLPLLLYMMGQLSIVGLPVNLLVLIFVPYAMLLSFITGVLGFIFSPLSLPFGFLSYLLLAYIFKVVEIFASLPFASIKISYFPIWLMIFIYVVYGYILFRLKKQAQSPKATVLDPLHNS